jgi:hypothetical protein
MSRRTIVQAGSLGLLGFGMNMWLHSTLLTWFRNLKVVARRNPSSSCFFPAD